MTLKELCKISHQVAVEKGFWDVDRNKAELLALIQSEVSEALESLREGNHHLLPKTEPPKEEIWKDIKDWESYYMVSNLGNVRSLNMTVVCQLKKYKKEGRVLKAGIGGTGYYTVSLKGKTHKVSRLVAEAFISNPDHKKYVNHINGNKLDDNVNNLEWVTSSENNTHALKTGLRNMDKKLSIEDKLSILSAFKYDKKSLKELAKKYKVNITSIKRAKHVAEKELKSFEMEISDVFIRLGDMCEALGIDIEWQINSKISYNKTRPHKHGKEF